MDSSDLDLGECPHSGLTRHVQGRALNLGKRGRPVLRHAAHGGALLQRPRQLLDGRLPRPHAALPAVPAGPQRQPVQPGGCLLAACQAKARQQQAARDLTAAAPCSQPNCSHHGLIWVLLPRLQLQSAPGRMSEATYSQPQSARRCDRFHSHRRYSAPATTRGHTSRPHVLLQVHSISDDEFDSPGFELVEAVEYWEPPFMRLAQLLASTHFSLMCRRCTASRTTSSRRPASSWWRQWSTGSRPCRATGWLKTRCLPRTARAIRQLRPMATHPPTMASWCAHQLAYVSAGKQQLWTRLA